MYQKTLRRKIKSIQTSSLFSGRYTNGIRRLHKLEKKTGDRKPFLYAYGILYDHLAMNAKGRRKRQLEKTARDFYEKALAYKVGGITPYWGLGRILLHNNEYAAGLKYYRLACKIKPDNRSARLAYAVALSWAGRFKEAKNIFVKDEKKYGPNFRSAYNLAEIEKRLKNRPRSRMYAKKALRFWRKNKYRRTPFGKTWEKNLMKIIGDEH